MNEKPMPNAIVYTFGCLFGLVCGWVMGTVTTGTARGIDMTHKEAIKAGVAKWTNGPSGDPEFNWLSPP